MFFLCFFYFHLELLNLLTIKYTLWKHSERKYLEHLEMRQQNSILILLLNKNNVFSAFQTVYPYVFSLLETMSVCLACSSLAY